MPEWELAKEIRVVSSKGRERLWRSPGDKHGRRRKGKYRTEVLERRGEEALSNNLG